MLYITHIIYFNQGVNPATISQGVFKTSRRRLANAS